MAFGVSEIIQNLTLHPRDEERQSKIIARDKPCLLQFNTFFWEVVLLFFFLLVCEILSPVCPPKIFFKNLHIDIQCFIQHKYRLRGKVTFLHRKIMKVNEVLKSQLLHRKPMKARFKLPMNSELAAQYLTAAISAEVEYRNHPQRCTASVSVTD